MKGRGGFIARLASMPRSFWIVVVIPVAVSALYYGLVASDMYVSESKFVIRSPQKSTQSSALTQLMQGSYSAGSTDGYAVVDYVESLDALKSLNTNDQISQAYSLHGDWVSRYHTSFNDSLMSLLKYYRRRIVSINLDDETSIITLKVMSYTPRNAWFFNEELLRLSENLVNKMNDRATRDAVALAQRELSAARLEAENSSAALAAYRANNTVFDPSRQSILQLQQISQLEQHLYALQAQVSQLRLISPKNSQIKGLTASIEAIQEQIKKSGAVVTGDGSSLSGKAAIYAKFELDENVAERKVSSDILALSVAQGEARKKHIYLERIVEPSIPDEATMPRRFYGFATVLISCLIMWATLTLFLESVREHKE